MKFMKHKNTIPLVEPLVELTIFNIIHWHRILIIIIIFGDLHLLQ